MRLFSVKDTKTGKLLTVHNIPVGNKHPAFFANKQGAKEYRDEVNRQLGNNYCHVSKGPDHRHYTGKV